MNAVIISCSSLAPYVHAAQLREGTAWPVIEFQQSLHSEPSQLKEALAALVEQQAPEVDTILLAMGFCGGAWDHVRATRKLVIPRFDDCVSLLLSTDDAYHANLKERGHLYLYENDPEQFSALGLLRSDAFSSPEYAGMDEDLLFHFMFDSYRHMDIIDTGLNDCYSEAYVARAQAEADQINAALDFTTGSIRTLEKLVSGRWDEQFLVVEPGTLIKHGNFFE